MRNFKLVIKEELSSGSDERPIIKEYIVDLSSFKLCNFLRYYIKNLIYFWYLKEKLSSGSDTANVFRNGLLLNPFLNSLAVFFI